MIEFLWCYLFLLFMKQNKYSSQAQNICPMCFFLLMVKLAVLGWTKKRMRISKWQDQNCHLRPCTLGLANKNLGFPNHAPGQHWISGTTGSSDYRHSILSLSSVKTALYHQTSLCWNLPNLLHPLELIPLFILPVSIICPAFHHALLIGHLKWKIYIC